MDFLLQDKSALENAGKVKQIFLKRKNIFVESFRSQLKRYRIFALSFNWEKKNILFMIIVIYWIFPIGKIQHINSFDLIR